MADMELQPPPYSPPDNRLPPDVWKGPTPEHQNYMMALMDAVKRGKYPNAEFRPDKLDEYGVDVVPPPDYEEAKVAADAKQRDRMLGELQALMAQLMPMKP